MEGMVVIVVIKERIRESDSLFPTIFHVAHAVFSTVGAEMLTGGSVGAGWDQLERGRSEGGLSGYTQI